MSPSLSAYLSIALSVSTIQFTMATKATNVRPTF